MNPTQLTTGAFCQENGFAVLKRRWLAAQKLRQAGEFFMTELNTQRVSLCVRREKDVLQGDAEQPVRYVEVPRKAANADEWLKMQTPVLANDQPGGDKLN
jgi:hypothetical protein